MVMRLKSPNKFGKLSFRQTTLEEYNEMVALVSAHIEKCFQAEANCYTKIDSGDLTVTFQSEYDNL